MSFGRIEIDLAATGWRRGNAEIPQQEFYRPARNYRIFEGTGCKRVIAITELAVLPINIQNVRRPVTVKYRAILIFAAVEKRVRTASTTIPASGE
jgi:hypothetical protein